MHMMITLVLLMIIWAFSSARYSAAHPTSVDASHFSCFCLLRVRLLVGEWMNQQRYTSSERVARFLRAHRMGDESRREEKSWSLKQQNFPLLSANLCRIFSCCWFPSNRHLMIRKPRADEIVSHTLSALSFICCMLWYCSLSCYEKKQQARWLVAHWSFFIFDAILSCFATTRKSRASSLLSRSLVHHRVEICAKCGSAKEESVEEEARER